MKSFSALLLLLIASSAFGQSRAKASLDSAWLPMKQFLGTWTGTGGGQPGTGRYQRTYQFVLNGNFLEIRNRSAYPPTEKNPNGEVHEDLGYLFYDKARKTFLLRQMHIEGFANDYVLDSLSSDGKTMVFLSENIVNIPKGWKAKETYRFTGTGEVEETFELAAPGKPFEVYSKVKLNRK